MTLTELAERLGKNKSTISKHATRLGLGTRRGKVVELTDAEVKKLAAAVALARAGNPNRGRGGKFAGK